MTDNRGMTTGSRRVILLPCRQCDSLFASNAARQKHLAGKFGTTCLSPRAIGLVPVAVDGCDVTAWTLPGPEDGQVHD